MIGSVNWLMIGLLQYDFVAGLFGFQASIFSRLIYILFGVGAAYLLIRAIVNKGSVKIYEKKKKKKKEEETAQNSAPVQAPAYANVEASKEQIHEPSQFNQSHENNKEENENQATLFDEHMKKF